MPGSKDSIPPYGEEGLLVTRYLVSQIVEGRANQIEDKLVDLTWKTFRNGNKDVVAGWITKWPGKTDKNKKVRDFYNKHKKDRFEKYISTGEGNFVVVVNGSFNLFLYVILSTLLASLVLSTTGYTRDFLKACPELVRIGGADINAGSDDEEGDDAAVFADQADPAQADPGPEPIDIEQDLQDAIDDLAGIELTDHEMKIITKRINYQPVRGAPIDVPTAIHAVVAVLEPGAQLSTITSFLLENQQDGVVRVMLAPELNLAQKLLPFKNMVRQNPSIGNTLSLAIQEVLNEDETDKDPSRPRPISKGEFSLSNRGDIGGIDGPLDPTSLGLKPAHDGDKFILHKVSVSNASGTVPCFVAVFFFLEERTQKILHSPHFERTLPGFDHSPPPSPDDSDMDDTSPPKRRRAGGFSRATFTGLFGWN
jgi:hypothetical protein